MIVNAVESKEGIGLTITAESLNINRQWVRRFLIDATPESGDEIYDILPAIESVLPAMHSVHPANDWAYVNSISIEPATGNTFAATVTYNDLGNPETRLADVSYSSNAASESIDQDYLGEPIQTSSDEPIIVEEDFHDGVFTAEGLSDNWVASTAASYRNTTNNGVWYGNPKGTCLLVKYDAVPEILGGNKYWRWSIEIHYRSDGWKRRILDQGLRTKATDGTISNITDSDGNPITSPVRLNGAGQVATGDGAYYWLVQTKGESNFGGLPITIYDVT